LGAAGGGGGVPNPNQSVERVQKKRDQSFLMAWPLFKRGKQDYREDENQSPKKERENGVFCSPAGPSSGDEKNQETIKKPVKNVSLRTVRHWAVGPGNKPMPQE